MTLHRKLRCDCRPMPADFAAKAPTMTIKALCQHYSTGKEAVRRWLGEAQVKSTTIERHRPVPKDFAAIAPTMTKRQIMVHYSTGYPLVLRWIAESGVTVIEGVRCDARPVPKDFAERARVLTLTQLAAHYDINQKAVHRWFAESGVTRLVRPRGRPQIEKRAPARIVRPAAFRPTKQGACFDTLPRDASIEGQAADHLRRFCAVYRCTETGRADQHGAWWRYGNAILSPAELIARAERHGFDAGAWRRLAA